MINKNVHVTAGLLWKTSRGKRDEENLHSCGPAAPPSSCVWAGVRPETKG